MSGPAHFLWTSRQSLAPDPMFGGTIAWAMERSRPHADAEATLAERARQLARAEAAVVDQEVFLTVVVVKLGKECLGLPAHSTRGVYEDVAITPVLGLPPWIAGVAQVRGELMSVVHPSHWLGQPTTTERPLVAVLVGEQGLIGMLVDDVVGARDLLRSDISDLLTRQAHREQRPIDIVTNDLVAVLDVQRFFEDPDLVVGQKAGG